MSGDATFSWTAFVGCWGDAPGLPRFLEKAGGGQHRTGQKNVRGLTPFRCTARGYVQERQSNAEHREETMAQHENRESLREIMEELGVTDEDLDLWSSYQPTGLGQFYREFQTSAS